MNTATTISHPTSRLRYYNLGYQKLGDNEIIKFESLELNTRNKKQSSSDQYLCLASIRCGAEERGTKIST